MELLWKTQLCAPTVQSAVRTAPAATTHPSPTMTFGPSRAVRSTRLANDAPRAASMRTHRSRAAVSPSAVMKTSSACGV